MSVKPLIIHKVALAVLKDGKILMARSSKNYEEYYFLGGKPEEGESEIQTLEREVREEACAKLDIGSVEFLHEVEEPAHGKENTFVNIRLYKGGLLDQPAPGAEIAELHYFDSHIDQKHLTPASEKMFAWLKIAGYIN